MTRKIDNNINIGSIDVQKDVDYQREIWLAEVLEGYQPGLVIFQYFNISIFQNQFGCRKHTRSMVSFTMKFSKPWVAKRSHHLRQTAKISERHSSQFLGVASIFLEAFNLGRSGWVRRMCFWKDWIILFTNSSLFAYRWFSIVLSGALRLHGSGWNAFAR